MGYSSDCRKQNFSMDEIQKPTIQSTKVGDMEIKNPDTEK